MGGGDDERAERNRGGPPVGVGGAAAELMTSLLRTPAARRSLDVAAAWVRAVGPRMAKAARPVDLRGGVLRIRVSSPAWRSEIDLRSREILERLRQELGPAVARLHVRVGVLHDPLPGATLAVPPPDRAPMPALDALAERIADPALRELARALATGGPVEPPPATRRPRTARRAPRGRRG
jgi:hypothetical protein